MLNKHWHSNASGAMAEAVGSSLPCGPMACAPEVKPTWAVAATPKWLGFVIGRQ